MTDLTKLIGQQLETRWLPVVGFPGYEVSDNGQVRNRITGQILAQKRSPKGQLRVGLCRDGQQYNYYTSRLMLTAFVRLPVDDEVARHLDDNPANNLLSNLAWGSQADNHADAVRNGLKKGREIAFTPEEIRMIRNSDESSAKLADQLGVSQSTISRIRQGVQYKDVE